LALNFFNSIFRPAKKKNKRGKEKRSVSIKADTENIIAFFAGLGAIIMIVAMVAHCIEVYKLTVSIASLSGVTAGLAKFIQARRGKAADGTKAEKKNNKKH
jgi:hypothetical protein